MLALLKTKAKALILPIVTAVGFLMVYLWGRDDEQDEHQLEALEQYKETRDEIDAVDGLDDPDERLDRMRDNDLIR